MEIDLKIILKISLMPFSFTYSTELKVLYFGTNIKTCIMTSTFILENGNQSCQLTKSGDSLKNLAETFSIWLFDENIFKPRPRMSL